MLPVTPGAGTAAALSQQERDATASICQQRPPTLHSRAGCGAPGRGAPQHPAAGLPQHHPFLPRLGSEGSSQSCGRAGHIPPPGRAP